MELECNACGRVCWSATGLQTVCPFCGIRPLVPVKPEPPTEGHKT